MGSFDMTCALSSIGISVGDPIYALVLMEGQDGDPWTIVTRPARGYYGDYGRIDFEDPEEEKRLMTVIRRNLVPCDPGKNSVHQPALDPETCSWDEFNEAASKDRAFAFPVDAALRPKKKPNFWGLKGILNDAGIDTSTTWGDGDCVYVYSGSPNTNFFVIEPPHDREAELFKKVRDALDAEGTWSYAETPSTRWGVNPDTPGDEYPKALLVFPRYGQTGMRFTVNPLSRNDAEHRLKVVFVRDDVFDAIAPLTEDITELAKLLRERIAENAKQKARLEELKEESQRMVAEGKAPDDQIKLLIEVTQLSRDEAFFLDGLTRLRKERPAGVWYARGFSAAAQVFLKHQFDSMTGEEDLQTYEEWVRLSHFVGLSHGLRMATRPPPHHVGSQCATEDWPDQLSYHRQMVEILEGLVEEEEE